ncbi:MAG: glucosaminidase domain-containing protein [Prevotella sp.]|nr:glucosaminidase domain-containing protein [Prevotella sp.]
MKKYLIICLVLSLALGAAAQRMCPNAQYQAYVDQYKDLAIQQMLKYKIPASITLAQGILESRAGLSDLAVKGNNHFGIKCHGWTGRTVYHDDDERSECFRAYDDVYQSFEDHSQFLQRDRYKSLFTLKLTDYKGWANGLKKCGYATSPTYATQLIQLIDLYGLNEYDHAKKYDKFMAEKVSRDKPVASGQQLHPIYIYNKNYYLFARKGDTFRSIGQEVDISYRKLAKRNERNKNDVLNEGDIIYLKKKQKRALKQFKNQPHTVKSGESLYDIAQMYGIRLKSLYKMNKLDDNYMPRVGDKLRVR